MHLRGAAVGRLRRNGQLLPTNHRRQHVEQPAKTPRLALLNQIACPHPDPQRTERAQADRLGGGHAPAWQQAQPPPAPE
jgi:hypothetical protein